MYPLPAHTVKLVLQHISPLTAPLPPHLISTPLRQRHHYLQILPSTPVEYLCWPSPDNARAIDLLPSLSDQDTYPTRYTSDPESAFAHVQVSSTAQGLRMLFHWEHAHGWMYHDLRLMPFPSSSFSTPQEALASNSICPNVPPQLSPARLVAEADHINEGRDDSYWDAYGDAGHELTSPLPPRSPSQLDAVEGEDAYWARYASVQGSADSTVPSPLPINRKLRPVNLNADESGFLFLPKNNPVINIPVDAIHSRHFASRLGPPSPNTLADHLGTISPRRDIYSPVSDKLYTWQSSAFDADPQPDSTAADSELITPPSPNGYQDTTAISPVAVKVSVGPLSKCRQCLLLDEGEDRALTDSIKGLYYLWKAGKKAESDGKDRHLFLQIVQEAIAYE